LLVVGADAALVVALLLHGVGDHAYDPALVPGPALVMVAWVEVPVPVVAALLVFGMAVLLLAQVWHVARLLAVALRVLLLAFACLACAQAFATQRLLELLPPELVRLPQLLPLGALLVVVGWLVGQGCPPVVSTPCAWAVPPFATSGVSWVARVVTVQVDDPCLLGGGMGIACLQALHSHMLFACCWGCPVPWEQLGAEGTIVATGPQALGTLQPCAEHVTQLIWRNSSAHHAYMNTLASQQEHITTLLSLTLT
jgi:hypothetical protein